MTQDEVIARCALHRIFGFNPLDGHALLEAFGSAVAVFDAPPREISERLGPFRNLAGKVQLSELDAAHLELQRMKSLWEGKCTFVPYGDADYPEALAQCPDAPLGLYVRTEDKSAMFDTTPNIAIVGTRDISSYGRASCRQIVEALSQSRTPPRIVSGLAMGTDITAHLSALEHGLPTIGVLPCGIDAVFPSVHWSQADKIAVSPRSGLVSDYPLRTSPKAINFLRRNRIIAGLSRATIVVESKAKGGSLITAQFAFDYDREVYALPGRIEDVRSRGCNTLIRMHTAHAIDTVESLVALLGLGQLSLRRRVDMETALECRYGRTGDVERLSNLKGIMQAVKARRGITPEEISRAVGLPYGETVALLGLLQSDGFIESDLLQRYSLV